MNFEQCPTLPFQQNNCKRTLRTVRVRHLALRATYKYSSPSFVCLSVCLSLVCLFSCLFICLSVYQSVCLFVCLWVCRSVGLSVCRVSVCLSVGRTVCLSVCLPVCLPGRHKVWNTWHKLKFRMASNFTSLEGTGSGIKSWSRCTCTHYWKFARYVARLHSYRWVKYVLAWIKD